MLKLLSLSLSVPNSIIPFFFLSLFSLAHALSLSSSTLIVPSFILSLSILTHTFSLSPHLYHPLLHSLSLYSLSHMLPFPTPFFFSLKLFFHSLPVVARSLLICFLSSSSFSSHKGNYQFQLTSDSAATLSLEFWLSNTSDPRNISKRLQLQCTEKVMAVHTHAHTK